VTPELFLSIASVIPALIKVVGLTIEQVTSFIRAMQATAEQESSLLVIARETLKAEQVRVRTAPRLDPAHPDQLLPPQP
jgi:hypothetical protein